MPSCRVCGDEKSEDEFRTMPNFTKYKKHRVQWCKHCQKLYMDMKKEKERNEKIATGEHIFSVSFK